MVGVLVRRSLLVGCVRREELGLFFKRIRELPHICGGFFGIGKGSPDARDFGTDTALDGDADAFERCPMLYSQARELHCCERSLGLRSFSFILFITGVGHRPQRKHRQARNHSLRSNITTKVDIVNLVLYACSGDSWRDTVHNIPMML